MMASIYYGAITVVMVGCEYQINVADNGIYYI